MNIDRTERRKEWIPRRTGSLGALHLLGGHVMDRPHDLMRSGQGEEGRRPTQELGQAEVGDLLAQQFPVALAEPVHGHLASKPWRRMKA
jgi:hypothetical protein